MARLSTGCDPYLRRYVFPPGPPGCSNAALATRTSAAAGIPSSAGSGAHSGPSQGTPEGHATPCHARMPYAMSWALGRLLLSGYWRMCCSEGHRSWHWHPFGTVTSCCGILLVLWYSVGIVASCWYCGILLALWYFVGIVAFCWYHGILLVFSGASYHRCVAYESPFHMSSAWHEHGRS